MAHEKISDEEILRRADAIKELQRIEGATVHPGTSVSLLKNRQAIHIPLVKQQHQAGPSYAEIAAEIFLPLLEKGLDEYRKRIDAISDGKA